MVPKSLSSSAFPVPQLSLGASLAGQGCCFVHWTCDDDVCLVSGCCCCMLYSPVVDAHPAAVINL